MKFSEYFESTVVNSRTKMEPSLLFQSFGSFMNELFHFYQSLVSYLSQVISGVDKVPVDRSGNEEDQISKIYSELKEFLELFVDYDVSHVMIVWKEYLWPTLGHLFSSMTKQTFGLLFPLLSGMKEKSTLLGVSSL
eukprot:TRINITY_DN2647_c0_g1_i2.p2 TRINITY_DN2647_c0_g1~~TRINITY_DN2647_c0_g1_i2.p2  ORF type:complete len:136 (-),score=34.16 TRINITY_DN2647_c0_g1_i2:143-550(-)